MVIPEWEPRAKAVYAEIPACQRRRLLVRELEFTETFLLKNATIRQYISGNYAMSLILHILSLIYIF